MSSTWIAQNPHAKVPDYLGFPGPVGCIENKEFVDWITNFMGTVIRDYPVDGIIWDEPKDEALISRHPDTLAKFGPEPTEQQMEDSFVEFLGNLNAHCLSINPNLINTLFNQKTSSDRFTRASSALPGIQYAGYDGNLSRQSFYHEEPFWNKYRLESVWDRTVQECKTAGKGTFALVENMLMPKVAIPEYRENLDAYLQEYRPDHLSLYYYAHNNEDPETVHQITRELMQRYL